jgi:hypothetical protein
VSADTLRRAAERMRREHAPFFDYMAEWLEDTANGVSFGDRAEHLTNLAEAYLDDPGPVPEVVP